MGLKIILKLKFLFYKKKKNTLFLMKGERNN